MFLMSEAALQVWGAGVDTTECFARPLYGEVIFCDQYRHESETVARCATLGRSQDVCKGFWFTFESERCVVGS